MAESRERETEMTDEEKRTLTDAANLMHAQSLTIEQLLAKVADLSRELRNARIMAGQHATRVPSGKSLRAWAMKAAERLGVDFHLVTARNIHGGLYRDRRSLEGRGLLVLALRAKDATPAGPLSYPDIADVLGFSGHSGVMDAERLAERTRSTRPFGWEHGSKITEAA